jgi:tetratricopeptide (TPR) repeat protein
VYIVIYPPDKEEAVRSILGDNWDVTKNRKLAEAHSLEETVKDPKNGYAWFNLGSNQVYFENYVAAAKSYDKAREVGLPQRMLRYQFGPFIAYFHSGRTDDLMTLLEYALQLTPNSEEAMLWKGWGLVRQGKKADAQALFTEALKVHPNYEDALYAINFVNTH